MPGKVMPRYPEKMVRPAPVLPSRKGTRTEARKGNR